MILLVTSDPAAVTIEQTEDLKSLAVWASSGVVPGLDGILRAHGVGSFDGAHAWLDVDALRAAGPSADHAWHNNFDAMVRYAAKRGWMSADERTVRAHYDKPNPRAR